MSKKRLEFRNPAGMLYCVPKDYLRAMPWDEAIVLAYLAEVCIADRADKSDGWFRAKRQHILAEIGCSNQKQTILLKRLEARKLIKLQWRGKPKQRHVKIEWVHLMKLIRELPELKLEFADDDFNHIHGAGV